MIQNFKLGELFEIQLGKTPARGNKNMWDQNKKSNNIWLSIKDLNQADANGYVSDSDEYISDDGAKLVKLIPKDTLLLSFKLTLGRTAITKVPLRTNEAIAALLPKTDQCNIRYLKYYFEYFDFIKFASNDFKVKGLTLNKKKLADIPIPVPSHQEQEKIVERLDKVFENIDKLTEDSAKNIENSKNLFFSFLNETFRGNSSEDLIELEKLSTYISRGLQPKYIDKAKTLVINQRCIRDNQINFEVGRYHDQSIKKVSDDKKIQIGDILINSTGVGTLGRVAQVTELPSSDVTVDTHVTIFRPNFNILNKEFTNWLFIYLENLIEKMGVGASGQTELRREDLKNMKIINPPNEKIQQNISDKLNNLKNPYDNYLKLKEDLIIKYSMLRKSILDKEFSYE